MRVPPGSCQPLATSVRGRLLTILVGSATLLSACTEREPTRPSNSRAPVAPRAASAFAPGHADFFLSAHPDDWQLFWGNRLSAAIQGGGKVVIIYTTAGEAGRVTSFPSYGPAREEGANASLDFVAGAAPWVCANSTVNGHSIYRCEKGTVISYYMRLPDGGGEGNGFGYGSLKQLRDVGTPLTATDNATTYNSWSDLTETVRAIVDLEGGNRSAPYVSIHASDYDEFKNGGDHVDHLVTGTLVRDAAVERLWDLFWYVGYGTMHQEPNLTQAERDVKWNALLAYDAIMVARIGESLVGTSHAETWVWRTIYRLETGTEIYLTAHPDDWQLFVGSQAVASLKTTTKLVFVYITAGDSDTKFSNPAYWRAREAGSKASVDTLARRLPAAWSCPTRVVNGHPIIRCTRGKIVSYYMRLPDGGSLGRGYGYGSLNFLRDLSDPLEAVDFSTTYTSWDDLIATLNSIISTESAGAVGPYVTLHTEDWDRDINYGDHPDHHASGDLARALARGRVWEHHWYRGYGTLVDPQNLDDETHFWKQYVFNAYDNYMNATMGEYLGDQESIQQWLWRDYFRTEISSSPPAAPPVVPANLTATATSGTRILLNWEHDNTEEFGFRIERAPDIGGAPGAFVELNAPAVGTSFEYTNRNATSFANNGLANATTYWYRIRAQTYLGPSAYSNIASATTLYPPAAPSGMAGVPVFSSAVDLTWADNSVNEATFRIDRAPDVAGVPGAFVQAGTVGAGVTAYRANGLTPGTTYWFRVRSQNPAGNSAFTTPISVVTNPFVAPADLVANAYLVGTTRNVDLTWTPGSEANVDVWRNGTRIKQNQPNNGGPNNNKPANAGTFNYQVCAAGRTGAANCTAVVTVTF